MSRRSRLLLGLGLVGLVLVAGPRTLAYAGAWPAYPLPPGYSVTSLYGPRIHPKTGLPSFHTGIDLGAAEGTPILSATGGRVSTVQVLHPMNGNAVFVVAPDGKRWCYLHMSRSDVKVGQTVSVGDQLGLVGRTGSATGPHLHLQVYGVDGDTIDPNTLYPAGL